jgi:class 3 adenylate cyclase
LAADRSKQRKNAAEQRAKAKRAEQRERGRIERFIDAHGPKGWRELYEVDDLVEHVFVSDSLYMFVLSLDIHRSTFLMKEAVEFGYFASTLDAFVGSARRAIRDIYGGWFDKFTGDGFLAYWILEDAPHDIYHAAFVETMTSVLHTAHTSRDIYNDLVLEEMRHNSRNMPTGLGVSIGLDAGPGYLVEIAGELTVVGPPVVGAVRMVEATIKPGEILANVYLGSAFQAGKDEDYKDLRFDVSVEERSTKEYKEGQEIYVLTPTWHDEEAATAVAEAQGA